MSEEKWQDLVDLDRLRSWLDAQGLGAGKAPKATGDKLHDHCTRLFNRALKWID